MLRKCSVGDKDFVRRALRLPAWKLGGSKMGRRGVYPRMFFKECGSGFKSRGCAWAENKCVQTIEKKRFTEEGFSKRGAFT